MNKLFTYIKYELKLFLGNFGNMFWMMAFPLLLLTVFTLAFSSLRFEEIDIDKAKVGYHEDAFLPLSFISMSLDSNPFSYNYADNKTVDNNLFTGTLMTEEEARKELEQEKIDVFVKEDLSLVVNKNGINQLMMDEVITMYKQILKLNLPLESFEFNRKYVSDIGDKFSPIDVIFYSLFSMITLYGSYLSSTIGNKLIVRDEKVSLRNITSSTPMSWQVSVSVLTCFIWSVFMVGMMIFYTEFILKQNFFSMDLHNVPLILSAIVFGLSWGLFIGTFIAKESTKIAALIGSLLAMSSFSGLYSDSLRIQLQRMLPFINELNPINIIGNEFIKINMLSNYTTISKSIGLLFGYSLFLIAISTIYIRRKKA
ncbi:MAG: ABC transporter permease [Tissierellia bacterium]|nr:ABC transporter permease [Tissierellia bacterium]